MEMSAATTTTTTTMNTSSPTTSEYSLPVEKNQELMAHVAALPGRQAFLDALQRVPELVEKESCPLRFLMFDKGCVESAAHRLVKHWKERVQWFGERAFLPLLDLSGNGALTAAEVKDMQSGIVVQLPNDKTGRPVVLVDPERIDMDQSKVQFILFRLRMYTLCKLLQVQEDCRPFELVVIRVMAAAVKDMHLIKTAKGGFVDVLRSFPIALGAYHFCSITAADPGKHYSNMVIPALLTAMGKEWVERVHVHVSKDADGMGQKLSEFGLERQALPLSLGGTWSYAAFETWLSQKSPLIRVASEAIYVATEKSGVSEKRPAFPSAGNEQVSLKRFKVSVETALSTKVQGTPTTGMEAWMTALRGIKNDRKCSIRKLLRRPGIRMHALSGVAKAHNLSVSKCKEQLESAMSKETLPPNRIEPVKEKVEENIHEELKKAQVRTRLLKKLLARTKDRHKAITAQRPQLATKLPLHTSALRNELISRLRSKLNRS